MTNFRIVYEQSLEIDEHNQITEIRPWTRIELGYEAIQTGWFRRFGPNWIDLAVLQVIGLHARPLQGDDFGRLSDLDLVGPTDLNRLYARITDVAVADLLGCSREWINKCTIRLGHKGLLRVLPLPQQFRDSRGQFSGNNAYLLSGQVLVQSDPHRVNLLHTVGSDHVNLVHTVGAKTAENSLHRVNSVHTKILNKLFTPATDAGAAAGAAAAADRSLSEKMVTAPVLGQSVSDRSPAEVTGNAEPAHRSDRAAETSPNLPHREAAGCWQRLETALQDHKTWQAFETLLAEIDNGPGFSEPGLRLARLGFTPLPERRRRVLDDLRKMQGNTRLPPHTRSRNVIGILTQNIAVTLGLGLQADGRLRMLADKDDYTAVGALVKQYGAEEVWNAACLAAGQAVEGDPLDYLRGVLLQRRERRAAAAQKPSGIAGLGRFDDIDYQAEATPAEVTT